MTYNKSFSFDFDFPSDGDDEVDGGPTGDEGGDGHHGTALVRVAHWDGHLYVGHVDLVRQVEPLTLGRPGLVTVGEDSPVGAVGHDVLLLAAQQNPGVVDLH